VNGDGTIDERDVSAGNGASSGGAASGGTATGGGAPGLGNLADLPPRQLRVILGDLADSDLLRLKKTCAEVLASPGSHSDSEVEVCQVVASL
jgi:hypothetical protein